MEYMASMIQKMKETTEDQNMSTHSENAQRMQQTNKPNQLSLCICGNCTEMSQEIENNCC